MERRQYIRLSSVLPIEFSLIFIGSESRKYQGFTHDISKGGLCVRVRDLKTDDADALAQKRAKLRLSINISPPLFLKPIYAVGNVAWFETTKKDSSGALYSIGVAYEDIDERSRNRIINYARRLKWIPRATAAVVAALIACALFFYFYQEKTKQQNRILVSRLIEVSDKTNDILKRLNTLNQAKQFLEKRSSSSINKIRQLQGEISKVSSAQTEQGLLKISQLQNELEALKRQNLYLENKIANIGKKEIALKETLTGVEKKAAALKQANIEKMRDWISTHRNRLTGLVISYEGDNAYRDWSFTYDQALAVQAFLLFNDIEKASCILDFYKEKAKRQSGLFYNAYDAKAGSVVEYTVHSGPNLWIAISACKFTSDTNNNKYLKFAQDIADTMISMQRQSKDGAIKGGPGAEWVSTEHNMDAYALFNMLYELTKDQKYKKASEASFGWLKENAYNKPEARFNRGKGDATIATDTFSWAIASIGPEALKENEMDPDAIMEFAEDECRVKAIFYRPDGQQIEITGFDFAKAANLGRGGVVSCEWTAQMVVALKIMADYYRENGNVEKSSMYSEKAQYYLAQLSKMAISSPSPSGQGEGCLPYASIDNVDTGHGWRVAKGRRTGSVAATIYYIFAQKGYNPLKL